MSFGIHEVLPVPFPYFTVIRHPVDREVSRFRSTPKFRKRGLTPAKAINLEWGMVYQLSGIPGRKAAAVGKEHVKLALRNLRNHFLFIGDTSRFPEIGEWMRDAMGWAIELPLPHDNKAKPDVTVSSAELDELRAHPHVQLDQLLYDRICELGPYPKEWTL
jgi:hypothetical protein